MGDQHGLIGLREAIKSYPWLTIAELARWSGAPYPSLRRWMQTPPNTRHFELLYDFIEGRIVPVKIGDQVVFERVEPKSESESLTRVTTSDDAGDMISSTNDSRPSGGARVLQTFSLFPNDVAAVREAAREAGMTLSGYVRQAIWEKRERDRR